MVFPQGRSTWHEEARQWEHGRLNGEWGWLGKPVFWQPQGPPYPCWDLDRRTLKQDGTALKRQHLSSSLVAAQLQDLNSEQESETGG